MSDIGSRFEATPQPVPAPSAPGPTGHGLSDLAKAVAARLSVRAMSPAIMAGLLGIGELLAVVLIGVGLYPFVVEDANAQLTLYVGAALIGGLLAAMVIQGLDGYAIPALRRYVATLARILVGWAVVLAILATIAFFFKIGDQFSRLWLASWFACTAAFLIAERVALAHLLRRWSREGKLQRRAVIVGGGPRAEALIASLESQEDSDVRICGIFDDRNNDRSPQIVAGYQKLGTIDELVEFGRLTRLDMLIVTVPVTAEARVLEFLKKLWVLPVDIRLSAHADRLRFRPRSYSFVGTVPFIDVVDKPLADWDAVAKRAFDLFFGVLGLVVFSPVMLAAAVAIKLDSRGPVFFRQKRYGFNNELINVWKFRSMRTDQLDANAAKLVTKDDPRVTRVGRFIRKSSIDELPQLFNVILGNLSLVGPRPHALSAKAENRLYEQVVDGYFARHKVKPGVTGWAQINGWRGETDTSDKIQKRVDCDLYYIENWSIGLDLYILFATPFRLFNTENAY